MEAQISLNTWPSPYPSVVMVDILLVDMVDTAETVYIFVLIDA